ncbi:hypothetical protein [Aestuariicoccus sp. MJ-SS9]|uniref:hypothetical protein n=1 Tax=Aestuariicoccus sp. MJ-SS9 TaxID=3079855 RepID=UPI00290DB72E|nr:hypothetical protein [Aestuariicoccus sp. MJ-SS9]MDU8910431.1 hypothetical protein [Aestuariicoccus sp. MJ-SS9]
MDDTFREFNRRHREVTKKHRRLAHGYVTKINRNGVIEHHPRSQARGFSFRSLAVVLAITFIFKGYLLAGLGQDDYSAKVSSLAGGNWFEMFGAWAMQIDPLTQWIAGILQSLGV